MREKSPSALRRKHAHLGSGGLGDLDTGGGIAAEQAPAHGLLERGMENSMGVGNRARREFFLVHLVKHGLEIERREVAKLSLAEYQPDIPTEQRGVVREGLRAQLWPGSKLEPAVEVLVEGQLRAQEFLVLFALGQAGVEIELGGAEGAAKGAVRVDAPAGFRVASEKNTHQPPVVATVDDLPLSSCQAPSFHLKNPAHNWHTRVFVSRVNPVSGAGVD
jgi:hypothetical protein